MKHRWLIALLILVFGSNSLALKKNELTDEKRYGQKPPGITPEIYNPKYDFLEGLKTEKLVFTPDGTELCFTMTDTTRKMEIIYYMKQKKSQWTKPEIAYFVQNNGAGVLPQFSPDGKYFAYMYKGDFWRSRKESGNWLEAEKLTEPVCTDKYECGFSFTRSGDIYFAGSGRAEGHGKCDIYCSKFTDNQFGPAQNLNSLNTDQSECTLSVAPGEEYIIFTRYLQKQGNNATDLWISFQQEDSTWSLAQKLGPEINSDGANSLGGFSADEKYFFFNQIFRNNSGGYNIKKYWVSTRLFDELRKSQGTFETH